MSDRLISIATRQPCTKQKKVKRDAKNMEFYNAVVDVNDKSFDVTTAPEAWKNESYVLLAINTYINVGSKKGQLTWYQSKKSFIARPKRCRIIYRILLPRF